jgi:hypothetical protein
MYCMVFAHPYARFAEMMPFGMGNQSAQHYTKTYSLTYAALHGDDLTRRKVYVPVNF